MIQTSHSKRHIELIFAICFLVSNRASALPGFPEVLQVAVPGIVADCSSCHNPPSDTGPQESNVTKHGFELYHQMLSYAQLHNTIAPIAGADISHTDFAVFGDTRSNPTMHQSVVTSICSESPRMTIHTGDMVASGSSSALWNEALNIERCLIQPPILNPACGNHEGSNCTNNAVRNALGNNQSYYTFDFEGFTFIALNSENMTSAELSWLAALPVGRK